VPFHFWKHVQSHVEGERKLSFVSSIRKENNDREDKCTSWNYNGDKKIPSQCVIDHKTKRISNWMKAILLVEMTVRILEPFLLPTNISNLHEAKVSPTHLM